VRTRIKFCGLTHNDDISAAIGLGADAIGFNCYKGSKRFVSIETLSGLSAAVPAFVVRVGVFVNPDRNDVRSALPYLDLLQFHGDETAEFCGSFERPYMKAVRVSSTLEVPSLTSDYPDARAVLIDKHTKKRTGEVVFGGSGETVKWHHVSSDVPLVLAGGLDPDNVASAICSVRPFAVDVASGIESANERPGRKSRQLMSAFVAAVRQADMEN